MLDTRTAKFDIPKYFVYHENVKIKMWSTERGTQSVCRYVAISKAKGATAHVALTLQL